MIRYNQSPARYGDIGYIVIFWVGSPTMSGGLMTLHSRSISFGQRSSVFFYGSRLFYATRSDLDSYWHNLKSHCWSVKKIEIFFFREKCEILMFLTFHEWNYAVLRCLTPFLWHLNAENRSFEKKSFIFFVKVTMKIGQITVTKKMPNNFF